MAVYQKIPFKFSICIPTIKNELDSELRILNFFQLFSPCSLNLGLEKNVNLSKKFFIYIGTYYRKIISRDNNFEF